MKKTFILLAAVITTFLATANNANAQYNTFSKGNILIQGVIGIPTAKSGTCHIPPFGVSAEYGILDFGYAGSLGVGASFEYSKYDFNWAIFEVIAGYHYFFNPKIEAHAKVGGGYYKCEWLGGFSRSIFVGASYFFNDHVAVTVEAGASMVTCLRAGITINL